MLRLRETTPISLAQPGAAWGRRGGVKEYKVIGKTDTGRFLEFVYEDMGDHWFVFHAMPARPADVKLYRRKVK